MHRDTAAAGNSRPARPTRKRGHSMPLPTGWPKSIRGNGLWRVSTGVVRAENDPPGAPPDARADSCHIHPWIFSPLWASGVFPAFSPSLRVFCARRGH